MFKHSSVAQAPLLEHQGHLQLQHLLTNLVLYRLDSTSLLLYWLRRTSLILIAYLFVNLTWKLRLAISSEDLRIKGYPFIEWEFYTIGHSSKYDQEANKPVDKVKFYHYMFSGRIHQKELWILFL